MPQFAILQSCPFPHPDAERLELVLAHLLDATYQPYVVWIHNVETDGYGMGSYYVTRDEAEAGFVARYARLTKP